MVLWHFFFPLQGPQGPPPLHPIGGRHKGAGIGACKPAVLQAEVLPATGYQLPAACAGLAGLAGWLWLGFGWLFLGFGLIWFRFWLDFVGFRLDLAWLGLDLG